MANLSPQQNEEPTPVPQPTGGRTPFLRTRVDADGFRVFTDDPTGVPIRYDAAIGKLVVSDDDLKERATAARVAGPASIIVYRPS